MITFRPLYRTLAREGLKLKDLAERMGVSYGRLHQILTYGNTSVRQVENICSALMCRIDEVIEDDGQYEPGWESVLNEINERRNPDDNRIRGFVQEHPWLEGLDPETARKILLPVQMPAVRPSSFGGE